jgi:serine phosphatase RsbU (regulator of sigma subunit)
MAIMEFFKSVERDTRRLRYFVLALLAGWTGAVGASGAWNLHEIHRETLEGARITARAAHFKDVIYRRWNAAHGGVYVPVKKDLQPNPHLTTPARDVETLTGRKLTLVNPAFMTRMAHEIQEKVEGVRGHITSLKPIRPENAADPWETKALAALEKGDNEVSSVERIHGEPYLRLMRPLATEKGCLACHAAQGYKEGDIRGGISVSVPIKPLWNSAHSNVVASLAGHAGLWFLGVLGIFIGARQLEHSIAERDQALQDLREANTIVMESIEYARTIQEAMLPGKEELYKILKDCFVIWMPRDVIGGDFFWCESSGEGFAVAVGDCTGHGVPGAFMTAIACTTLNRVTHDIGFADPAAILTELNRLMKTVLNQHAPTSKSDDGLDIALCFVDKNREFLIFAGAGASLSYTAGDEVRQVKGDKQSIGYRSSSLDYCYTNQTIALDPGMAFYMMTDGLAQQTGGEKGLSFGRSRFTQFLREAGGKPFHVQQALLEERFRDYKSNEPQLDDVTVLGFTVPEITKQSDGLP